MNTLFAVENLYLVGMAGLLAMIWVGILCRSAGMVIKMNHPDDPKPWIVRKAPLIAFASGILVFALFGVLYLLLRSIS